MDSRFDTLFLNARDLATPAERDAFLDEACAGDAELRRRLESKLIAEAAAADYFGEAVTREDSGKTAGVPGEEPGAFIGPFKLLQQIGEGGFGTVWMADQQAPVRRRVALKIIKQGLDTKEVIARFEQERQALAMMDHANIARVLDVGATHSGRPFFVMELVRGVKITEYCDENGLGIPDRVRLFIQVCHAVHHAHQKGVIHRDIKPSNVLVTINDGEAVVKVIDFGVAKATLGSLTDATLFTQFHQMIGTPAYMSPEQAEMTSLDIDTRSDIYSLGVLLYELITGRTPIDTATLAGAGLDEIRRVIREVTPARPSARVRTLSAEDLTTTAKRRRTDGAKLTTTLRGDLDWIAMMCLEKDRKRRYDSANALALDLERYLGHGIVTARPPTASYLLGRLVRRNKAALAVAVLIFAVLIAASGISLWQANLARKAAADALNARNDSNAKATAERVAREESEAIMKFFVGVFKNPDPARSGRTITVAETLDTAAMKLKTDLATQPGQRAKLQYTIGLTFHSLDLAPEAIPLLEAALDYYRAALGSEHPTTLMVMGELGFSYTRAGRQGEALKLQEERVMLSRRIYSMRDPDMLAALASLANCYADVGRRDEALKLQEEVLSLTRTIHGPADPDTLKLMSNLAVSYAEAGREDEALKIRDEVVTVSRKVNGPEHPDTLAAMGNLAISYDKLGRREDALALEEDVIRLRLKVNGPKHTETLTAMTNLAISYGRGGNLEKALKMLEDVLKLRIEGNGPDHPETLMAMTELAVSYGKGDRMAEAIAMQEKALASMRQLLPPKHPYLLNAMKIMSALYWQDGRREEAHKLRLEREALEGKVEPTQGEQRGSAAKVPANAVASPALIKQELKLLEVALDTTRKTSGLETPETIAAMTRLALAYGADGSGRKAILLGEEALKLAQRLLPPDNEHTIHAMKALIPLYKSVDLNDEARKLEAELQSLTEKKQK